MTARATTSRSRSSAPGSSAYGWRGAQSGIGAQCREVGPSQGTVTTMNTPQIVGENALARRVLQEDAG